MRRIRWIALAAVACGGLWAPTGKAQPPYFIDNQHADLAVEYVSGSWRPQVRSDSFPGGLHPDNAILVVNHTSITNRPTSSSFDFIGVGAGEPYWRLNQSLQSGQLYLGVSSDQMGPPPSGSWASWTPPPTTNGVQLDPAPWAGLRVVNVRGPAGGHFSAWQSTDTGPIVFVSTAQNGYQSTDNVFYSLIGSHLHYNWGFTEPGRYEIDINPIAYYGSGPTLLEGDPNHPTEPSPFTFTFEVRPVPEPGMCLLIGAAGAAVAAVRRLGRRGGRGRTGVEPDRPAETDGRHILVGGE